MIELPPALRQALNRQGRDLGIVVVRLGAMGDILRTLPAVRILRRELPESTLHWMLEEKWQAVLEGHPDLTGLIPVPRKAWRAMSRSPLTWNALRRSLLTLRRDVRDLDAGLLLDFHGNLRSGFLACWSGIPVRLGYAGHQQKEGNHLFTTHQVASGDRRTPRMERNLDLLRGLGLPDSPLPAADLPMVQRGAPRAEDILRGSSQGNAGFAVVSPGASAAQAYKRPPTPLLAAACDRLSEEGVMPLIVYGPGEEPEAQAVLEQSKNAVLAPPTDLPTLTALLSRARLFVGGDSGPLHLACATGCAVIGVYGPTDPKVNQPWAALYRVVAPPDRHYTGIKRKDRASGGFDGVKAEQLTTAVDELLDQAPIRGSG